MNTGSMPSTSVDKNVGANRKKVIHVDQQNLMVQGESRSRMNRLDLGRVPQNPVESGDSDCGEYN